MIPDTQVKKLTTLAGVFTPSAPIMAKDLFAGRTTQITKTVQAILERGQHAILYGERGVGKTSLANIIPAFLYALSNEILEQGKVSGLRAEEKPEMPSLVFIKVTCNRSDSFGSCWKKALRQTEINQPIKKKEIGFFGKERVEGNIYSLDRFLPEEINETSANDVIEILSHFFSFSESKILFIFDEFDSIFYPNAKKEFADLIKTLSDNIPSITLLLVGIGDSITDLIGEHPSVERCIRQILLPRMSSEELSQIVEKGLKSLDLSMEETVKEKIVAFSQGFPHYTHLLCKYACERAILNDSQIVDRQCFDFAVNEALENAQESIRDAYQKAVMTTRKQDMFKSVVAACALVEEDEHGTFRIADLQASLQNITGKDTPLKSYSYHIDKLCHPDKGSILKKVGTSKKYRYRFSTPLLKAFVTLKLYQEGFLRKTN